MVSPLSRIFGDFERDRKVVCLSFIGNTDLFIKFHNDKLEKVYSHSMIPWRQCILD